MARELLQRQPTVRMAGAASRRVRARNAPAAPRPRHLARLCPRVRSSTSGLQQLHAHGTCLTGQRAASQSCWCESCDGAASQSCFKPTRRGSAAVGSVRSRCCGMRTTAHVV